MSGTSVGRLMVNSGYVAVGAALGGVLRYLATVWIQGRAGPGFPIATLVINVSGSLLLGIVMGLVAESTIVGPGSQLLLATGLCGGFTTFSTFSYETFGLLRLGAYGQTATYVGASVVLSLGAMFVGFALARTVVQGVRGAA
ncbi:MAG TPA: fluoride efflux transporter CrcB [Gemmatimonadaceae bacterium]|nr:fluoride efflux transporter CrcB [Gemmatimonadaceae bacterium]